MDGSRNFKSRSRNPFSTAFDLTLHYFVSTPRDLFTTCEYLIFGLLDPDLPIHYTTFTRGYDDDLRVVNIWDWEVR